MKFIFNIYLFISFDCWCKTFKIQRLILQVDLSSRHFVRRVKFLTMIVSCECDYRQKSRPSLIPRSVQRSPKDRIPLVLPCLRRETVPSFRVSDVAYCIFVAERDRKIVSSRVIIANRHNKELKLHNLWPTCSTGDKSLYKRSITSSSYYDSFFALNVLAGGLIGQDIVF